MATIACPRCGHRTSAEASFCPSCGAPLTSSGRDDTTITFHHFDPLQESLLPDDDIVVDLSTIPAGSAVLVVRGGSESGLIAPLEAQITRAGRHPRSEIFLDDITVSRRHCEIERLPDGYIAVDVGSLNGTYLNGGRIERAVLHHGDELQIGKFHLMFLEGRA
ncbi:MAG: FHA domain-containing protein [Acidimicrobiales bacterium]